MRRSVIPQYHGSALIAVVALLMILALMGTAYLVVVRTDRQSGFARGVVNNIGGFPTANPAKLDAAQIIAADLVRKNLVGILTRSLTGIPHTYRDPAPDPANAEYPSLFDYPGTSTFMASRYPESRAVIPGFTAADTASNRAYWPFIGAALVDPADTINLTNNLDYICLESPLDMLATVPVPAVTPPAYPKAINDLKPANILYATGTKYPGKTAGRHDLRINSVALTYPATFVSPQLLSGKTRVFPAFVDNAGIQYLAADAMGAGLADSALFRLNVTPDSHNYIEDPGNNHPVTYWAALHIVDNNAAVNVNTAWRTLDKDLGGTDIATATFENGLLGTFRSNISLETLGATVADMTALDTLRFGQAPPAARALAKPMNEATRTPRGDYTFDTQGDAMENQLARRLTNPGWLDATHRYTILPLTDSPNMAYQFGLYNPNVPLSQTEQTLSWSAVNRAPNFATSPQKAFAFYPSNADDIWFNTAYNDDFANLPANQRATFLAKPALVPTYSGAAAPGVPPVGLRSMLVSSNPLTASIAPHSMVGNTVAGMGANQMTPFDAAYRNARKVSVNTGQFGDLWRGFWEVMCDDNTPIAPANANIFRSTLRYPPPPALPAPQLGTYFTTQYEMYLRAGIAAVNTISMRSPAAVLPQSLAGMQANVNSLVGTPVNVRVASLKAQPYITEIYADTNSGTLLAGTQRNANGYMAIEIHNPSNAPISLAGIRLVSYTRNVLPATGLSHTPATDVNVMLTTLTGCPASLNPNSFIVIENVFQYRPVAALAPVAPLSCTTLHLAFGKELFLLRSDQFPAEPPSLDAPGWVALDAYDFTGLIVNTGWVVGGSQPVFSWHYVRQTQTAVLKTEWRCVYPGRYNPAATPRQEGTQTRTWPVVLDAVAEGDVAAAWTHTDGARGTAAIAASLGAANPDASYANTFRIPLVAPTLAMANPIVTPNPPLITNKFPFGAFGRDGDMLQIPFIGNYAVRDAADSAYIDLVPVTMDAAFADDIDDTPTQYPVLTGPTNNGMEQIGRFCSMKAFDRAYTGTDNYAWANKLFDYLTAIHSPKDDMSPNVDPVNYAANGGTPALVAVAVRNDTNVLPVDEDLIPIHGLININTASWQVLATIPWTRLGDPAITTAAQMTDPNRRIAKAIVRYRDINNGAGAPHGPFKSIVELNQVPVYAAAVLNDTADSLAFQAAAGPVTGDFSQSQGELSSGAVAAGDGLSDTYKEHFLVLTRVSNLLTTRSDSFTAYILVQAWQDAGTRYPVLLGERRSAYIFDRQAPTTPAFTLPNALKETSVNTN